MTVLDPRSILGVVVDLDLKHVATLPHAADEPVPLQVSSIDWGAPLSTAQQHIAQLLQYLAGKPFAGAGVGGSAEAVCHRPEL